MIRSLIAILVLLTGRVFASTDSIALHSMICGDKSVKLTETRQISFKPDGTVVKLALSPDGNYLAFVTESPTANKLCLTRTSGGRIAVVATGIGTEAELSTEGNQVGTELWDIESDIDWAADSKSFVVTSTKTIFKAEGEEEHYYINTYSNLGRKLATIETAGIPACPKLSSTGRQVAAIVVRQDASPSDGEGYHRDVVVIDTATQAITKLPSSDDVLNITNWIDAGTSLLCHTLKDRTLSAIKKHLDGSPDEVVVPVLARAVYSPDLRLEVSREASGVVVRNASTKTETSVIKSDSYRGIDWSPNGRLLAVSEDVRVTDHDGKRLTNLRRLWIARPDSGPCNTLLVSQDVDTTCPLTWSADGSKIAYVSRNRAYLAELELGEPTIEEKLTAGIKLTEDEEKRELLRQAWQVGVALKMYCTDWDGAFPSADAYQEDLRKYGERGLFNRPGTDTNAFKYLGAGLTDSSIEEPTTTPMGEYDAGYSWKVVLYADGHATVVAK